MDSFTKVCLRALGRQDYDRDDLYHMMWLIKM